MNIEFPIKVDGRTKEGRDQSTEVVTSDLRALLFWANVGVAKSFSGSYLSIVGIIDSYSEHLNFKLPYGNYFGSEMKRGRK